MHQTRSEFLKIVKEVFGTANVLFSRHKWRKEYSLLDGQKLIAEEQLHSDVGLSVARKDGKFYVRRRASEAPPDWADLGLTLVSLTNVQLGEECLCVSETIDQAIEFTSKRVRAKKS